MGLCLGRIAILVAEVMTVTQKLPCPGVWTNPVLWPSENWGFEADFSLSIERQGRGHAIECPRGADPGQSLPVRPLYSMTGMKQVPLTEHSGLCSAWSNHLYPAPRWTPVGSLICHGLEFGGLEYALLLVWNILPCFKHSSGSRTFPLWSHPRLPNPYFYSPGVHCFVYLTITAAVLLHLGVL